MAVGRLDLGGGGRGREEVVRRGFSFAMMARSRERGGMLPDPMTSLPESSGPVLLFDGACGLCQRMVRVLIWLDRKGRLRFAPLQGQAAQVYLRERGLPTEDFETLIYVPDWGRRAVVGHLVRTAGALAALRVTGGAGARGLAAVVALCPGVVRDGVYRWVGRRRLRIFGRGQAGGLDRPEWAGYFLP